MKYQFPELLLVIFFISIFLVNDTYAQTPNPPGAESPDTEEVEEENNFPNQNDEFHTQTQGGWGSSPNGNNPGRYLHDNFDNAFPNGIVIGKGNNKARFTSAQSITDFLPSGGKPQALSETHTNPTGLGNNLLSQTLALELSVGFDKYDSDFSKSNYNFHNAYITSGAFKGWKISELLEETNNVLGGEDSQYKPSELNDALSKCNQAFVDGKKKGSFISTSMVVGNDKFISNEKIKGGKKGKVDKQAKKKEKLDKGKSSKNKKKK